MNELNIYAYLQSRGFVVTMSMRPSCSNRCIEFFIDNRKIQAIEHVHISGTITYDIDLYDKTQLIYSHSHKISDMTDTARLKEIIDGDYVKRYERYFMPEIIDRVTSIGLGYKLLNDKDMIVTCKDNDDINICFINRKYTINTDTSIFRFGCLDEAIEKIKELYCWYLKREKKLKLSSYND